MICPSPSGWHGICALSLPQGGAVGLYLLQPFRLSGLDKYWQPPLVAAFRA